MEVYDQITIFLVRSCQGLFYLLTRDLHQLHQLHPLPEKMKVFLS